MPAFFFSGFGAVLCEETVPERAAPCVVRASRDVYLSRWRALLCAFPSPTGRPHPQSALVKPSKDRPSARKKAP
jgi:hypothetical protein